MNLTLDHRSVTVQIDELIEARDGLEDSGLMDQPGVARACLLLRRIVDEYHGTVWGAINQTTGKVIEAIGQEAAEVLVEQLEAPWVLAAKSRDGAWAAVTS